MACCSRLIPAEEWSSWNDALSLCGAYDTYHLPEYHLLAQRNGEGDPFLFYLELDDKHFAVPLLVRPLAEVHGLESCKYFDCTSVYGYPGAITSLTNFDPNCERFQSIFLQQFIALLKSKNIIAFFTRQNPLLPSSWLFEGGAEIVTLGETVAIDLSVSEEEQLRCMSKGHRYDIRKSAKADLHVWVDLDFRNLNEFISLYNYTMDRNNALGHYYFPQEYYLGMKKYLGDSVQLYFASKGSKLLSGSLFLLNNGIIQYHLSGSLPEAFSVGAPKAIINEVRRWGSQNGYKWLHLGGGVAAHNDALFRFKSGFSRLRFPYQVIKIIIDQPVYKKACKKREDWLRNNDLLPNRNDFFPAYR